MQAAEVLLLIARVLRATMLVLATFNSSLASALPIARSDFNGDGRSDILWRNASTGENYIYLMNGTAIVAEGYIRTVADVNWTVAGVGDFNGDGKADILWRNRSTGQNYIYFMDGTSILPSEGYIRTVSDQTWEVAGIGDFNGDGRDDILWRNRLTGENYVYFMNGLAILPGEGYVRTVTDQSWQVAGIGDFDGDGVADILWRNASTGQNYVYLMNALSIKSESYIRTVADQAWQVMGVADFNGDGKADILWRNGLSGENYLYPMSGTTILGTEGYLRTVADPNWTVAALGDFNGDGKADILWRNAASGDDYLYPMNGTAILATEGYVRRVADLTWQPAGSIVSSAPKPPVVGSSSVTVNVLGVAPSSVASAVTATDPQKLPLTYSIKTQPLFGSVSIAASTGAFTYLITGHAPAASDSFGVTVSNGRVQSTAQVTVLLASDPLLKHQWHIQNTGQDAFSSTFPVAGNDMNVTGAWAAGYSGKGIKIGVADTGLEAAHEDLAANVDLSHSFNFLTGLNDPSRAPSDPGFDHGTAVAGIIGAVAFNAKGGRGVAYGTRLRGYNLLAPGAFSVANMAASLGSAAISADNDLFNVSFEVAVAALPTFSGAYQSIAVNSLSLRGGLGAAIVNAAGNEFLDWPSSPGTGICNTANTYRVSCGNPAADERRGGYVPIIVGAIDGDGRHSSYSNTGSSLWISAPGGEYGLNASYTSSGPNFAPAIVTTSRSGCVNSANPSAVNALDSKGANPLAPICQYTATMNGTSAATPNVAGVVAMMLEANPKLSVRDIKYILAKTARRVDANFSGVSASDIIPGSTVVLEQGWVTNSAGWSFSNRYGLGAVDAAAAVTMAKSYTAYLPPVQNGTFYQFLAAPPATITPLSPTGNFLTFSVSEPFNTVEFVVVFLNIASTPGLLCNQVELRSPSGTKSILMHAANGFSNISVVNSRFLSNAFYGEPVNGTWTLTFFDFCSPTGVPTRLSTTNPQLLGIVGH